MSQLDDTIPQSWRFTCPLAYVLVDGKQIANGEVDLVVKCEAGKSPASASRRAEQPTTRRHRLMVYVPKEAEAKVSLSLDGFLTTSSTVPDPASIRYSAQRRRLLINGSSRLASRPIHDLRFSKGRDLLDAVSRLNRIGIICADDDRDPAADSGSQSSTGSRSQTTSPAFLLSAEMMKARRVMSPLQRRPDGSTPPFCLIQVPNGRQPTLRPSSQESNSSQQWQESQLMLPPRRELNFTSTRASAPVGASRDEDRSTTHLESISPVLPVRTHTVNTSLMPEKAPGPSLGNNHSQNGTSSRARLKRVDSIADSDYSSSQPAKRRRVSQPRSQDRSYQETSYKPGSYLPLPQSQDTTASVEVSSQQFPRSNTKQAELIIDPQVQLEQQNELNAAMADHFWRGNMQQTMIWDELRDELFMDVEAAGDDDQALESLVEKYQLDLHLRLGGGSMAYM